MQTLRERIDGVLNRVLVPLGETPYNEIKESIKEENLPISFFAEEAIKNFLVTRGSYYLAEGGKELLGGVKEAFTEEFIKENFWTVEDGFPIKFPIKIDSFIHQGIKVCRQRLFGNVLNKGMIEKRADSFGIRVTTFLFVLMVFVINKAIEKKMLGYVG